MLFRLVLNRVTQICTFQVPYMGAVLHYALQLEIYGVNSVNKFRVRFVKILKSEEHFNKVR